MSHQGEQAPRFPLLEQLATFRDLPLLPIYKIHDAAVLLGASVRTLNDWIRDGRLPTRELPGRGRFLPQDLEDFLAGSVKKREVPQAEPSAVDVTLRGRLRKSAQFRGST